jgi:basic membrane protein A
VVACLVDSPITVVKTAEQRHIFAIGYHSAAAAKFAPKYWLSGVAFNWGPMFVNMTKAVMNGTWKAQNEIAPAASGVAYMAPFGPKVPTVAKSAAKKMLNQFMVGERESAYTGPVYDQSGKLRIKAGETPDANFVNTVTWFVKGMIGKPK